MGALPRGVWSVSSRPRGRSEVHMRRRTALAIAGATAMAAGGLVAVMPKASAAVGCKVDYAITNQWSTGFIGSVTITNLGDQLNGWNLQFDFPAGQTVTNGWN